MATRRPRVKPSAILKPRRVPSAATASTPTPDAIVLTQAKIEELINDDAEILPHQSSPHNESITFDFEAANDLNGSPDQFNDVKKHFGDRNNIDAKVQGSNTYAAATSKQFHDRASIIDSDTFKANLIARRKSSTLTDGYQFGISSPTYMKSPSHPLVRSIPKDVRMKADNDEEAFGLENEDCFKSPPFMSPSFSRRGDPNMSPYNDSYEDCAKSPSSAKMRQRIRPTPCFANRRNSIQGTSGLGLESDEIEPRRSRQHSTSSNHSNYNAGSTPQHTYQRMLSAPNRTPTRIRTESMSSSVSDTTYMRDSAKMKRNNRSEEYQRVSNAKREFNLKLNGKPPDKSNLTMYDLIYYNPLTNPMTKPAKGDRPADSASLTSNQTRQSTTSLKSSTGSRPSVNESRPTPPVMPACVPQLKLGLNGDIIIDEKSLVIQTTGDIAAQEALANSDIVYDDEYSGTSGFYKRQKRTKDWLPMETIKFYRSLQAIGTDFSVMLQLFPNRSRRDLKLKFKKEEKYNMALINKALLHPKEFNVEELKFQFDKEDEEIETKKQEWTELRKRIVSERKQQLAASKKRNPNKQISRTMRDLTAGDLVYENEFAVIPKRKSRNKQLSNQLRNTRNAAIEAVFSPSPIHHSSNHHLDIEHNFTYATHKLPNFSEMITLHKSKNASIAPSVLNESDVLAIRNNNNDSESHMNANDRSNELHSDKNHILETNLTISSETAQSDQQNLSNEHPEGDLLYSDNEETANFKSNGSTDDIMNMDIVFDNVPMSTDSSSAHDSTTIVNEIDLSASTHVQKVVLHNGETYDIFALPDSSPTECRMSSGIVEAQVTEVVEVTEEAEEAVVAEEADVIKEAEEITLKVEGKGNSNNSIQTNIVVHETNGNDQIIMNNKKDKNDRTEEFTTSISVEAEKERAAKELEERRRKRKPLPILAIKYKRRRKFSTSDGPIQSSPPDANKTNNSDIVDELPIENEDLAAKPHHLPGPMETIDPLNIEESATVKLESQNDFDGQNEELIVPDVVNESEQPNDPVTEKTSDEQSNFMNSLVVVESHDPHDPSRTIYAVHIVDPITKIMSDQPLDLPDDVIQRIRQSI